MKIFLLLSFLNLAAISSPPTFAPAEVKKWVRQAKRVEIRRDEWGVPHIYGRTDDDAVFGLAYVQAEDNLWAIEEMTIVGLGRAAEVYGRRDILTDLLMRGICPPESARAAYVRAEPWLKALLDAYADGVNFFLLKHPQVRLRLISRFEPWYALLNLDVPNPMAAGLTRNEANTFLQQQLHSQIKSEDEKSFDPPGESGSNAWALGASRVKGTHALLLINPHFSLIGRGLRTEAHLISRQGLDAYGSPFYGGFYIWQGFNAHIAWAHTNSGVDVADLWAETFDHPTDSSLYRYDDAYRRAEIKAETLFVRADAGLERRIYRLLRTHHGLVIARRGDKFLAFREAWDPLARIRASWSMAKAQNFTSFQSGLSGLGPAASTTTFADANGRIAYWHAATAPRRAIEFDPSKPLPGDQPAAEWQGLHELNETPLVLDPTTGFTANGNSTPYLVSGSASPDSNRYPRYLAPDRYSIRLDAALRLFDNDQVYTAEAFELVALRPYLPRMDAILPPLFAAIDSLSVAGDSSARWLIPFADSLRAWDRRAAQDSPALTLAYLYCENLWGALGRPAIGARVWPDTLPALRRLGLLTAVLDTLEAQWGTSWVPWGKVNRMQAVPPGLAPYLFSDTRPSVPVLGVPQMTGSVFDANAQRIPGQRCRYSTRGNTFVAVVALGPRVRARTIMGFGQSADPNSPHYDDQAPLYGRGDLKDAHFYFDDVRRHTLHRYHPGGR